MDALQEKRLFKLRLPKGGFWNKPNPAEDARWVEKDKVWRSMRQLDLEKSGAEPFWLLDGPPYANGELHMGHLLNKFLKDALARHALMSGRSVVWRSGWDCHGLPLELAAEKENPKGPRSGVEFVASCRRLAFLWMGRQGDAFKRLGLSADLEKPWATMDKEKEAKGLALLRALREAGLLVERHAPAHWCPACGSALAASELERETKPRRELWAGALFSEDSQAKLCAHRPELAGKELALAFWTTTPWSLGGNKAFAFAKEARFGFWERADGFVFCAAQAADEKMKERGLKKLDVEVASDELAAMGLEAQLPFFDEARPVAPALFASALEGTGFVHVAPAFGPEDFEWGETMGLDAKSPVGKRGAYEEGAGAGLKRKEAGALFEEKLSSANLLLAAEEKEAEGFVCWRHNAPVFWRSSRQWALDLEKPFAGCPEGLAGRALALLDQTEFQPSQKAKQSLRSMLRGRRFWTLSRDRAWGLPLPFLRDASGNLHPDEAHCWEKAQELLASGGVEAWQAWEAPAGWEKENQCVDVWFDSGVCRQTADEGLNRSPDLVCEGQDQSRGWFLSSMLLGAFFSAAPVFKTVFTHGFVVGEDGKKLSKSAGNAPDTGKLLDKHGADAVRFWALSQVAGEEVAWGKKNMEGAERELKDWRNFLRFLSSNMEPPRAGAMAQADCPNGLGHLAAKRAKAALDGAKDAMARGEPQKALASLAELRNWASPVWFELSKRALYCAEPENQELAALRRLLGRCFWDFWRALNPFMPLSCAQAMDSAGVEPLGFAANSWVWDESKAVLAQGALDWRSELMPVMERLRSETKPDGFALESARWGEVCQVLGLEPEHVFRGVAPLAGKSDRFKAWGKLQCARCRGFFSQSTALDDGLCKVCAREEALWG